MIALPRGRGAILIESANSLFRNILRISPSGSRFYTGPPISRRRKFFGNNILDGEAKKKPQRGHPATPALSIFCPQNIDPHRLSRCCLAKSMIPIDRGRVLYRSYHKVNTAAALRWNPRRRSLRHVPAIRSLRRPLQRADVLDDRLAPAVDVRPLAIANAVLVAGHVDHVALAARRGHRVVRLLVGDDDQAIVAALLVQLGDSLASTSESEKLNTLTFSPISRSNTASPYAASVRCISER
jgi:hypothetical protein